MIWSFFGIDSTNLESAIIFGCVIYYAIFGQLFLAALYITLYLAIIFGCVIYYAIFLVIISGRIIYYAIFWQLFLAGNKTILS